jgi:hypothetical protein
VHVTNVDSVDQSMQTVVGSVHASNNQDQVEQLHPTGIDPTHCRNSGTTQRTEQHDSNLAAAAAHTSGTPPGATPSMRPGQPACGACRAAPASAPGRHTASRWARHPRPTRAPGGCAHPAWLPARTAGCQNKQAQPVDTWVKLDTNRLCSSAEGCPTCA